MASLESGTGQNWNHWSSFCPVELTKELQTPWRSSVVEGFSKTRMAYDVVCTRDLAVVFQSGVFGNELLHVSSIRVSVLVQSQISGKVLDGLPWNVVKTFVDPGGWILINVLTFQVPKADQSFHLCDTSIIDRIPLKITTKIPSASTVI